MSNCGIELFTTEKEFTIIAGHTFKIPYYVTFIDNTPVDVAVPGTVIYWNMADYNFQEAPFINKSTLDGSITIDTGIDNEFVVHISSEDTKNLFGTFMYQIEIIDPNGTPSRPLRGLVSIHKQIPNSL